MKLALLISGIVELIGGAICYLYSDLIFTGGQPLLYRLYGLSALVIGILCILMFRFYTDSKFFRLSYMTMLFFQGALAMIIYSSNSEIINHNLGGILTHLFLFVLLLLGYLKDIKPDN